MATTIEYQQIVNQGFLYMNGMIISNDATTPNTVLDVSAGLCRDSSNQLDMNLGNYFGDNSEVTTANVSTSLNMAINGANGLDTGAIAASTLYTIYCIADVQSRNPTAVIASTATTGPLMPTGYSNWRVIGFAATDSSSHLLLMWMSGTKNNRWLTYDAPQATAVTAGHATTATAVSLTHLVPALPYNTQTSIYYSYVPATAGNALSLQPVNGTGFPVVITGQVAAVAVTGVAIVDAQIVTAGTVPEINYKVGNASDSVAISVGGFQFSI